MSNLAPIFVSVFLAELGDKTQLATLLFATDPKLSRAGVFIASAAALTLSSLLAVMFGEQLTRIVSPALLETLAGIGFVVIGLWILFVK
ncbi:MAG: TMEM165/GDT1 family protein [Deltaproteobacteria bacterium]|nr:TMEM165/GDT1 family protein [Deltaproteobacteria bacterium]